MKNLTLLIITAIFLTSCGKEEATPIEIKEKEKIILEVKAAAEYPLVLKSTESYVGVEYYKDYSEKDIVTVTINNLEASSVSEITENYQLSTSHFASKSLFKLPKITEPGDFKINISIKNSQQTITGEGTIRIVSDYSLPTVWSKLDRNYVNSRYFYIDRSTISSFTMRPIQYRDNEVQIGAFLSTLGDKDLYTNKPFIVGLPGLYTLTYSGNSLQQVKIINGDKIVDQNFIVANFYANLTMVYGTGIVQPQTNNNKVTIFKSGAFQLTVTETPREVSTIITLQ
ncbi:MAG: hypothetical protein EOO43_10660 [Flavobacterium sp.]|nr:MAG: hypothetical protein EOO43_10660 [Flavobacterium sp.]